MDSVFIKPELRGWGCADITNFQPETSPNPQPKMQLVFELWDGSVHVFPGDIDEKVEHGIFCLRTEDGFPFMFPLSSIKLMRREKAKT
jgi:hypothetical protein